MRGNNHEGVLITTINGQPVGTAMARFLMSGVSSGGRGDASAEDSAGIGKREAQQASGEVTRACQRADHNFSYARAMGRALMETRDGVSVDVSAADAWMTMSRSGQWWSMWIREVAAIRFSAGGGTWDHLLMNGSWISTAGERWQRPRVDMRLCWRTRSSDGGFRAGGEDAEGALSWSGRFGFPATIIAEREVRTRTGCAALGSAWNSKRFDVLLHPGSDAGWATSSSPEICFVLGVNRFAR